MLGLARKLEPANVPDLSDVEGMQCLSFIWWPVCAHQHLAWNRVLAIRWNRLAIGAPVWLFFRDLLAGCSLRPPLNGQLRTGTDLGNPTV